MKRLAWIPALLIFLAGVAWAATFSMGSYTSYSVGSGSVPLFVASADLRGVGKRDIVVCHGADANVAVLLGVGDGTFGSSTNYPVAGVSYGIAIGSLRNNGVVDLVVADYLSPTKISVLLGVGDGTFGTKTDFTIGSDSVPYPYSCCLGDFNGDGNLDVAVSCNNDACVSILLGDGTGSFATRVNYTVTSTSLREIKCGSLRNNGILDLIVANQSASAVSVLLGVGDGTFGTFANYPTTTGASTFGIALGDFNRDGKTDVAASIGNGQVDVLLGVGDGTLGSYSTAFSIGGGNFQNVTAVDMRGNGILDLVVSNENDSSTNSVYIAPGVGDGTFGSASFVGSTASAGAVGIAADDFDGDGRLDLVTVNSNVNTASVWLQTTADWRGETPSASSSSGAYVRTVSGERFVSGKVAR